jgi:hypothetical protein
MHLAKLLFVPRCCYESSACCEVEMAQERAGFGSVFARIKLSSLGLSMWKSVSDRYRCPERLIRESVPAVLSAGNGRISIATNLFDAFRCGLGTRAAIDGPTNDLAEYFTHERYLANHDGASPHGLPKPIIGSVYYTLRPFLPKWLRIALQRAHLHGWDKLVFPAWPVDFTVENLLECALLECMRPSGVETIPFIWFWPDGASAAAILTHDVETVKGRDFCSSLMAIDESFGFRSAFEIVPERRYPVPDVYLQEIRDRGHEIDVQDLNHDGKLFRDKRLFLSRVRKINEYGRAWGAKGFRSAILYRNLNWYDALEFEYDMSVPNVAHLDAQRGGCCTVFPYFIDGILELPVTTTQDYSLLHILKQDRIDLWKTQASMILQQHGLLSFIIHPDYLLGSRAQSMYHELLGFVTDIRARNHLWTPLPCQVNEWWRLRSQMSLVAHGRGWRIEGPGAERARVAYAHLDGGRVTYVVDNLLPTV